jgi:penicillin-binding protein 2
MNQRTRLSMLVIQILIVSLLMALFGRLFYLQVAAGPKYRDAALSIQSRDTIYPATRGLIVDSSGVPLALNRTGLAVTIDRLVLDKQTDKGQAVLKKLAKLLKLQYRDVYRKTRLCGELKVGNRSGCWTGTRYQPIPITKEASADVALQVVERPDEFPGVNATPIAIRNYPGTVGVNAAHLLGYLGPLTDADLAGANGKTYYRSESIGKSGLEIEYDSYLRGIPGIRTVIVDRKEAITSEGQNTNSVPGDHLVTSLDVRVQASTESALADAVARSRASGYRADSGAAVVMDVNTGRIIAMASYPTYDPNMWEKGLTVKQAEALFSEANGVPALSRPIQGRFAPASTFKVVSIIAAANAGYDLDKSYSCPANVKVGTRTFNNFESKAQGTSSIKELLAVSCDTVWYRISFDEWLRDGGLSPIKNPKDYFFKAAAGFQINTKTGIDLPSESAGRLPDRAWKQSWYDANKDFYCNYREKAAKSQQTQFLLLLAKENCLDGNKVRAGDAVNFSIGQGDTLVTPLKLTQMYASIANGGTLWKPSVGRAIVKTDGTVVKTIEPVKTGTIAADAKTNKFLQEALREVVVSGTATRTFAGFPIQVSGKTGTAEVFGRNPDGSLKDNTSWFASYAPSNDPQYAVVMMLSQGGYGSPNSGVGVRKIYETIFGVVNNKIVPENVLFPKGLPTTLPKISPATKVKTIGVK